MTPEIIEDALKLIQFSKLKVAPGKDIPVLIYKYK